MFKKIVICAFGLGSVLAVASFTQDILNGPKTPNVDPAKVAELGDVDHSADAQDASTVTKFPSNGIPRQDKPLDLYGTPLPDFDASESVVASDDSQSDKNEKTESDTSKVDDTFTSAGTPKKKAQVTTNNAVKPKATTKPTVVNKPTAPQSEIKSGIKSKVKSDIATTKPTTKPSDTSHAVKTNPTSGRKQTTKNQRSNQDEATPADPILERFTRHQFTARNGKTLNYRLLQPKYFNSKKTYPLVVFLHGAGERGSDNEAQLVHGAKDFANEHNSRKAPCFILFPQCPEDDQWVDADWKELGHVTKDQPTESMALVMELIDQTVSQQPIDTNRIYATGLSMGGFGVFDLISRRPKMFAAGAPLCGGGDVSPEIANRLAKVPMWIVHGDQDQAVNVERSRRMVTAIQSAGGKPIYTEVAGGGHDIWTKNFANEEFYKWLFSQSLIQQAENTKKTDKTKSAAAETAVPKSIESETTNAAATALPKKTLKETSSRIEHESTRTQPIVAVPQKPAPEAKKAVGSKAVDSKETNSKIVESNIKTKKADANNETDPGSLTALFPTTDKEQDTPPYDIQTFTAENLTGEWKANVVRHNGRVLSNQILNSMRFSFNDGIMSISQNGRRQRGKIVLGPIVDTGVVEARLINFAASNSKAPPIKGLCYFEGEQFVILLHAPGAERPVSFEKVNEGRLLVLERNE